MEVSRLKIFHNDKLYLYIPQFIFLDARTIGRFQQTCKANRNWNSVVLKGFEWKKIEALIGKWETDKMKQGANFTGTLYLSNKALDDYACNILAPALAEMKGLNWLYFFSNNIGEEGKKVIREAWEKAGKDSGLLWL